MNNQNKENKKNIPEHVGIIIDGNRRWASERNIPSMEGHTAGYKKLKQAVDWFIGRGVKVLSFYVFSTNNWKRSRDEVNYLMKLLKDGLIEDTDTFAKKGFKFIISGRLEELPGDLPEVCREAMVKTKAGANGIINFCLNYGGREEILDSIVKMIKNNIGPEQVHEGMVRKYLYNGDLPDVDLIIRTSGEQRLSGFLLWQSHYSELLFMKKYWPDFEELDAEYALNEYSSRKRRFGGD